MPETYVVRSSVGPEVFLEEIGAISWTDGHLQRIVKVYKKNTSQKITV